MPKASPEGRAVARWHIVRRNRDKPALHIASLSMLSKLATRKTCSN
jgi:hypothetical protein